MGILYALFHFKTVRYNELKRYMGSISFKSLSNALKELENDKLISAGRKEEMFAKLTKRPNLCWRNVEEAQNG